MVTKMKVNLNASEFLAQHVFYATDFYDLFYCDNIR